MDVLGCSIEALGLHGTDDDFSQKCVNIDGSRRPVSKHVDSLGTTLLVIPFKDGLVFAADGRMSSQGTVVNKSNRKIKQLGERIFWMNAGSAADTSMCFEYVKLYLQQHTIETGEPPRVAVAAALTQMITFENRYAINGAMIIGGWDAYEGYQVYVINRGAKTKARYATMGSGSGYTRALLDATLTDSMSKEEAVRYATKTVAHSMARDSSSGGIIRVVVVTKESVEPSIVLGNELPFTL